MYYDAVLTKDPIDFFYWIREEFIEKMPYSFETVEDIQNIGNLLILITNRYSYLVSLLSYTKILTRTLKRENNKKEYEDMVDRKESIQNAVDTLKLQYNSLSRLITIKQEINKELKMSESFAE